MNNQQPHPIEFALAIVLASIESLLWIINELAGFHNHPATTKATATVSTKPTIQPQATPSIQPLFTDLASLTKRQLQTLTGIKSSRYNKIQLQSIAASYA
jgi:hypothetical protein